MLRHPLITGALAGLAAFGISQHTADTVLPTPAEPHSVTITIAHASEQAPPPVANTIDRGMPAGSLITPFNYHSSNYRRDLTLLTEAAFHEARGDDWQKVVFVILNRVNSSHFPNTIEQVITQPWQFSYLTDLTAEQRQQAQQQEHQLLAAMRQEIHQLLSQRHYLDSTGGALYYYAHNKIPPPYWWDQQYITVTTNGHTFARWHRTR